MVRETTASARPATGKAAKMAQLVTAAADIFLAKGYHTATMNDVAAAAGMSKKTVYQLVDSKATLFAELLAHQQSLLVFPVSLPEWSVRDILVQNLICLAGFLLSPKQIAIIRLIMAEYTHGPDLGRAFHKKRFTRARNRLEICLAEIAVKQGLVLEDAREMAAMLFGMAMGEFHIGVLIGFRPPPGRMVLERRIRCAVDLFMRGLDNRIAPP